MIIPVGIAASYALLTLAVHRRLLDDLDLAIRDVYRPENVWGPLQIRAHRFVIPEGTGLCQRVVD